MKWSPGRAGQNNRCLASGPTARHLIDFESHAWVDQFIFQSNQNSLTNSNLLFRVYLQKLNLACYSMSAAAFMGCYSMSAAASMGCYSMSAAAFMGCYSMSAAASMGCYSMSAAASMGCYSMSAAASMGCYSMSAAASMGCYSMSAAASKGLLWPSDYSTQELCDMSNVTQYCHQPLVQSRVIVCYWSYWILDAPKTAATLYCN